MTNWSKAFELDALPVGGAKVFRNKGQQIAVFRLAENDVCAVDNQCPHEGYPLVKGALKGDTLTCCWHNYKFDLRNGACLKGDEAVRAYDTRIARGAVEVDVTAPDPAQITSRAAQSLTEGLVERRMGQVARDVVRLLQNDVPAIEVLFQAARFDAERAEWGYSHAIAVTADLVGTLERYPGVEAVRPIMQALELTSDSHVRRPVRETPPAIDPGADVRAAGERIRALVEAEDHHAAEGLLRGALERGFTRKQIEPWFFSLVSDHFLSFGHGLIYVNKVFDLLEAVGWSHAIDLLPTLIFTLLNNTREDVLPEWSHYRRRLAEAKPRFGDWFAKPRAKGDGSRPNELLDALVSGSRDEAFDALIVAFDSDASLEHIVGQLSLAGAERMLRFDPNIDATDTVQEGWLDVTHIQTFANACRHALERFPSPNVLSLFFQAARFANNAASLDRKGPAPSTGDETGPNEPPLEAVVSAIGAKNHHRAMALAARYLDQGHDVDAMRCAFSDLPLTDTHVRPIVVGHVIKNCVVAFEEYAALNDPRPILAFVKLAASHVRERWIGRSSHEAIRFVRDGLVPKTLT